MKTTKLILIRHGQTLWNQTKRYCGSKDIGLNRVGLAQAGLLCRKLKSKQVHKIYCSDKKRALQTAAIVFGPVKIEKIPGLGEIHFGAFEGLTHRQIMKKYAPIYKKWLKDPFSADIPQGEKLCDFKKRVIAAIKTIVKCNPGKTVAVVSHGGAISIFINHLLRSKNFWQQIPRPTSVSIIEYANRKPRIKVFNDTSHL